MKNFFDLDNPFMQFLNELTDVVILNLVCLLCCIPVVTIGASLTALHFVTMRMARNEAGYLMRDFFRSFRQNFRQATLLWLMFILISIVFYADYRILDSGIIEGISGLKPVIFGLYFFVCLTMMYAFPLLGRFSNTIAGTVKNALIMSAVHIFKTLLMAAIYLIPVVIMPFHGILPGVYILIGLAGPAYINSYIWKGIFKRYEPEEEED